MPLTSLAAVGVGLSVPPADRLVVGWAGHSSVLEASLEPVGSLAPVGKLGRSLPLGQQEEQGQLGVLVNKLGRGASTRSLWSLLKQFQSEVFFYVQQ